MDFTSKILVEKTEEGQRTSVGEKGASSLAFATKLGGVAWWCND